MLRGAGAAVIGLPLLEEMMLVDGIRGGPATRFRCVRSTFSSASEFPHRCRPKVSTASSNRSSRLRDKLLIMRNVDQVRCDESGINAHFDGASGAFTATPPDGEAKAGGASIDQVIRKTYYPKGLPPGMVPTLIGGTFFRRSRVSRYVHSYNHDGTVAATIQERPRDLFDRVFGSLAVGRRRARTCANERLRRSVLDSVVDQYRFYTGPTRRSAPRHVRASPITSNESANTNSGRSR